MAEEDYSPTEQSLLDAARLADRLQREKEGSLWKFIIERAAREADAAIDSLVNIDPSHIGEIAQLQAIAIRFRTMEAWMNETIEFGVHAAQQFNMLQGTGEEPE